MIEVALRRGGIALLDDVDGDLGELSWTRHSKGYAVIATRDRTFMHRVVGSRIAGRPLATGEQVHHGAGGRLDNRRSNLTVCSDALTHKAQHYEHPGVRWDRQRRAWLARPTIDGRKVFLGRHSTKEAAMEAVRGARHATA